MSQRLTFDCDRRGCNHKDLKDGVTASFNAVDHLEADFWPTLISPESLGADQPVGPLQHYCGKQCLFMAITDRLPSLKCGNGCGGDE